MNIRSNKQILSEVNRIREMMNLTLINEAVIDDVTRKTLKAMGYTDQFIDNMIGKLADDIDMVKLVDEFVTTGFRSSDDFIEAAARRAGVEVADVSDEAILAYVKSNDALLRAINEKVAKLSKEAAQAALREMDAEDLFRASPDLQSAIDDILTRSADDPYLKSDIDDVMKILDDITDDLVNRGIAPPDALRDLKTQLKSLGDSSEVVKTRLAGTVDNVVDTGGRVADDFVDIEWEINRIMSEGSDSEVTAAMSTAKEYINQEVNQILKKQKFVLPPGVTVADYVDDLYKSLTKNLSADNMDQGAIRIFDQMSLPQKITKLKEWIAQYKKATTGDKETDKAVSSFWDKFSLWVAKRGQEGKEINFKGLWNWVKLYGLTVGTIQGIGMLKDYTEYGDPFLEENFKDILLGPFTIFTDVIYPCTENGFKALAKDKGWKESDITVDADNKIFTHTRIDPKTKQPVVDEWTCEWNKLSMIPKTKTNNTTQTPTQTTNKTLTEYQTYVNGKAQQKGLTVVSTNETANDFQVTLKDAQGNEFSVKHKKDGSDWN